MGDMENTGRRRLNWLFIVFLSSVHLIAIAGTILYATWHGVTLVAVGVAMFYMLATGFSITAGYHRLFAHGSYRAHPVLRAFYLFFGAASFQNSALKWAADHRQHHAYVDEESDPYSIRKGFWWAHIGWMFFKSPSTVQKNRIGDLERDPLVMFQHRFYLPLAILAGLGLPIALGLMLADPWGCLIMAGFLRMVLIYQSTFCINSLAHTIGAQPYSDTDSSRDSVLTALISLGEGYHNFHHTFPYDYRNGVRAWHFDPTKWLIHCLGLAGMTKELVRTPKHIILKAHLGVLERRTRSRFLDRPLVQDRVLAVRKNLEALLDRWAALKMQLAEISARVGRSSHEKLESLRTEIQEIRRRFHEVYRIWRSAIQKPELFAIITQANSSGSLP
jgi:stearoyl-CoA desaturase (delta-9 desaturase)